MANEVAVREEKKQNPVTAFIESRKEGWKNVLPSFCTPARFARIALACIAKNPKLNEALKSDQGKMSLASCLQTCAELGIEPDGRRAHLIPYKDVVTLIVDYKGVAELVMRSGLVSKIHADKICKADKFRYNKGVIEEHGIDFSKPRGDVYAYFAEVTFKDGMVKAEIMSVDEVEAIRRRSKASGSGPWVTDFDEMAKKTVFKRLSKWLPLTPEVRDAIDKDNEEYEDIVATEPIKISQFEQKPITAKAEVVNSMFESQKSLDDILKDMNAPVILDEIKQMLTSKGESFNETEFRKNPKLFVDKTLEFLG